jgi:hypothetical protein
VSDKIPFRMPKSQIFPSHKNLMFLTTHKKTVILPMVGENIYRSRTDINQPLRRSNRRERKMIRLVIVESELRL